MKLSAKEIKKIRNNLTLENHFNKRLVHTESILYYQNGIIYKMYKQDIQRQKDVLELVAKTKFENAINLDDLLIYNRKIMGVTMPYDENFVNLKAAIKDLNFSNEELLELLEIMKASYLQFNKYNLEMGDFHEGNIGFSNGNFTLCDIDSLTRPIYHDFGFINVYLYYICIVLKEPLYYNFFDFYKFLRTFIEGYKGAFLNEQEIRNIFDYFDDLSLLKLDDLKEKYYLYKRG